MYMAQIQILYSVDTKKVLLKDAPNQVSTLQNPDDGFGDWQIADSRGCVITIPLGFGLH